MFFCILPNVFRMIIFNSLPGSIWISISLGFLLKVYCVPFVVSYFPGFSSFMHLFVDIQAVTSSDLMDCLKERSSPTGVEVWGY